MWRLGPHNYSLLALYQFQDPATEAAYRTRNDAWCVLVVRFHTFFTICFSTHNACDYIGGSALPLCFWLYLANGTISLAFLAATFVPFLRIRIIFLHAMYCCIMEAMCCCIGYRQRIDWVVDIFSVWVPELGRLHDANVQQDILQPFQSFIKTLMAGQAAIRCLMSTFPVWMCSSFTGLKYWTLFVYVYILGSIATFLFLCNDMLVRSVVYILILASIITAAFLAVSILVERLRRAEFLAQLLLSKELHASRTADSILNHTLKNTLLDAAADIEMYLAEAAGRSVLQDAITRLRRATKMCKQRQTYLKVVAGEYCPSVGLVALREFGQQLIAGRAVEGDLLDLTVLMDSTLLGLILENAINNGFQHGCPENPDVRLAIREAEPPGGSTPGSRRLAFAVSNAAHPRRPAVTPELAQQLFNGTAEVQSAAPVSSLSYHIGLTHCVMAARAGGISLALTQESNRVTFTATLDVQAAPADVVSALGTPMTPAPFASPASVFPPGVRFLCIDDSVPTLRLMEFHIKKACPSAKVGCYGESHQDVDTFIRAALTDADVVICDQNLDYAEANFYGTDVLRRLGFLGFTGMMCIRSANDTEEDKATYFRSGAHCFLAKDLLGPRMVEQLQAAYLLFLESRVSQSCALEELDCNQDSLATPECRLVGLPASPLMGAALRSLSSSSAGSTS